MFAASALTLGADGLTKQKHINSIRQVFSLLPFRHQRSKLILRWLAESLEQISYTSYFLAIAISVTVRLCH